MKAFVVISEESLIPLCDKYGIQWTMYKNNPVGEKKNHGLNEAMKLEWDYLLEIGSDDVLKNEVLDYYEPYIQKGQEFFGAKDALIVNSESGACYRVKSDTAYGMGRMVSRKALEKVYGVDCIAKEGIMARGRTVAKGNKGFFRPEQAEELEKLGRLEIIGKPRYKLWNDDIDKGLDNSSTYFMMTQGIGHFAVKTETPIGIDIKGPDNIWPFNPKLGTAYDLDKALDGLSDEEKIALFAMIKRNKNKEIEYAHPV